jgi:eukaryotic-like serine/threonine-protein kinase
VEGRSWDDCMHEEGRTRQENVEILMKVCDAIRFAHDRGVIHRDIKPQNIMVGKYGEVSVMDWGIALRLPAQGQSASVIKLSPAGTPAYMAPEMASGEPVDSRADIYALACVGYFLVTGHRIFEGTHPMQVLVQHLKSEPVPPSERIGRPVPPALERLLMHCLAKDPADRPPDAAAVAEALGAAGADDWTQADARRWWETTFTSPRVADQRTEPSPTLLEVAPSGREG